LAGFDEPALCVIILAARSLVSLAFVARAAGIGVFGILVHVLPSSSTYKRTRLSRRFGLSLWLRHIGAVTKQTRDRKTG
jgi:hypothetical protein